MHPTHGKNNLHTCAFSATHMCVDLCVDPLGLAQIMRTRCKIMRLHIKACTASTRSVLSVCSVAKNYSWGFVSIRGSKDS